jgi:hypothetical protein
MRRAHRARVIEAMDIILSQQGVAAGLGKKAAPPDDVHLYE